MVGVVEDSHLGPGRIAGDEGCPLVALLAAVGENVLLHDGAEGRLLDTHQQVPASLETDQFCPGMVAAANSALG
jgi:hypothetical protein